jgi:hypothetical protein
VQLLVGKEESVNITLRMQQAGESPAWSPPF